MPITLRLDLMACKSYRDLSLAIFPYPDQNYLKCFEPNIPCSSALKAITILNAYSGPAFESLLASSSIPATPEALSSAPLWILLSSYLNRSVAHHILNGRNVLLLQCIRFEACAWDDSNDIWN